MISKRYTRYHILTIKLSIHRTPYRVSKDWGPRNWPRVRRWGSWDPYHRSHLWSRSRIRPKSLHEAYNIYACFCGFEEDEYATPKCGCSVWPGCAVYYWAYRWETGPPKKMHHFSRRNFSNFYGFFIIYLFIFLWGLIFLYRLEIRRLIRSDP